MANTTNFGWETPDDTDLVKDGASAMRTLGNAIDTSLVDLKGGTTGQVLSKASNTDMDFTWVAQDDSNAIQNAIVDAKGDLISATAADTPARLASSGVNGQVLMVDTTTATGLKWGDAGGADNFALINSGGTALSGVNTITVNVSSKSKYFIRLEGMSTTGANTFIRMRLNSDTNNNYIYSAILMAGTAINEDFTNPVTSSINIVRQGNDAAGIMNAHILINGANASGIKPIQHNSASWDSASNDRSYSLTGAYIDSAVISSITIYTDGNNWDAGTIYVYGA